MKLIVLIIALFAFNQGTNQYECIVVINEDIIRFEHAISIIKKYETLHQKKDYPYVGYGHLALKGERFNLPVPEVQADSILRSDLNKKVASFSHLGKDSLLLGVLAYNVGEGRLLGHGKHKKSQIIKKIESGDRSFKKHYVSYHFYNGKRVQSIKDRRSEEFKKLYIK